MWEVESSGCRVEIDGFVVLMLIDLDLILMGMAANTLRVGPRNIRNGRIRGFLLDRSLSSRSRCYPSSYLLCRLVIRLHADAGRVWIQDTK